jgi:NAD(P)-dependent dehydrogenase (short-subunit alcohol dehydrogenase family)
MAMRQVAIVTGARRGIGRAISLCLAQAGFNLAQAAPIYPPRWRPLTG